LTAEDRKTNNMSQVVSNTPRES